MRIDPPFAGSEACGRPETAVAGWFLTWQQEARTE